MDIYKPEPVKVDETITEAPCDRNHNFKDLRRNSSGLECVAALAEDLEILGGQENILTRPQANELIQKLIQDFTEYNTDFLKEYLDVLQNNNHSAVKEVTNNIVFSIEVVLKQQLTSHWQWQESVLVVLLGWMCAIVLCLMDPHVQSPYRALGELLLHTNTRVRVRLASAFWRHLSPAQLIELSDMTTGLEHQHRSEDSTESEVTLANLLLRAALSGLQPERSEPQWHCGTLKVEEVVAGLKGAWAGGDADVRLLLVQLAARTEAVRELFSVAKATHDIPRSETPKVTVEMSKLRLLFLDDEKVNQHIKKKSNRRCKKEE